LLVPVATGLMLQQPPLAVLLQQCLTVFLTVSPSRVCGTSLLNDSSMLRRQRILHTWVDALLPDPLRLTGPVWWQAQGKLHRQARPVGPFVLVP
jgi:hypothetical protein